MNIVHQVLDYLTKNWIAVISLGLSSFVFYHNYLRSYRLDVRTTGRATITKHPFSEGLREMAISMELMLLNRGIRPGVIENVALVVTNPDKRRFDFRAFAILTEQRLALGKELAPPAMEAFRAFSVRKEETLTREILFSPLPASAGFVFSPGRHVLDVWLLDSSGKKWRQAASTALEINAPDIQQVERCTSTPQPGGGAYVVWMLHNMTTSDFNSQLESLVHRPV
ncbi:MAG: hypothetical protein Q7S40_15555 [Opitutaceae bacterium]|nr:hypothetical protein [Opitutaceae bacterium]